MEGSIRSQLNGAKRSRDNNNNIEVIQPQKRQRQPAVKFSTIPLDTVLLEKLKNLNRWLRGHKLIAPNPNLVEVLDSFADEKTIGTFKKWYKTHVFEDMENNTRGPPYCVKEMLYGYQLPVEEFPAKDIDHIGRYFVCFHEIIKEISDPTYHEKYREFLRQEE